MRRGGTSAVGATLRLLPQAGRARSGALAAVVVVEGVLPNAYILAAGALVSAVSEGRPITAPLGAVAGFYLAQKLVRPVSSVLAAGLGRRLKLLLRERVCTSLDETRRMAVLEDPGVAEDLAVARGLASPDFPPEEAVDSLRLVAKDRLGGAISALLLAGFAWWAPLVLLPAWVVTDRWVKAEMINASGALRGLAPHLRRAAYFRDLNLEAQAAKEVRVFGLREWLIAQMRMHWQRGMEAEAAAGRRHRSGFVWSLAVMAVAHVVVVTAIARGALRGDVSLGALTVYAQAILGMSGLGFVGDAEWILERQIAAVPRVLALCERVAAPASGGTRSANGLPREAIEFRGVRFSYPGHTVFDGLDLVVPAGNSLAIVGVNGAGKTTLVKLLAALYEPDSGRILVDGTNLAEIDPVEWRSRIGVIFQDFVRYPLSARRNVGYGRLELEEDDDRLRTAADRAGGLALIEELPRGWDSVLSRRYDGGVDLSGGQWQRIALARALFAVEGGAGVLVLDEPTANLDVRAEAELYDRFLSLTRGLTTILISHRFSSVRHADRICVLDEGVVQEDGSHDELVEAGGIYARLFALQASHYREAGDA